jgi:hypothetical protein
MVRSPLRSDRRQLRLLRQSDLAGEPDVHDSRDLAFLRVRRCPSWLINQTTEENTEENPRLISS